MKRQRAKFPWDLYWENKTYKLKRSIAREKLDQINHLHISHNTTCLPLNLLYKHCFQFPLDRCNPQEKIVDVKLGGQTRCILEDVQMANSLIPKTSLKLYVY